MEGNHEEIIPLETWELVQEELEWRKRMDTRYSSASIFFSKIKCSECGNWSHGYESAKDGYERVSGEISDR